MTTTATHSSSTTGLEWGTEQIPFIYASSAATYSAHTGWSDEEVQYEEIDVYLINGFAATQI